MRIDYDDRSGSLLGWFRPGPWSGPFFFSGRPASHACVAVAVALFVLLDGPTNRVFAEYAATAGQDPGAGVQTPEEAKSDQQLGPEKVVLLEGQVTDACGAGIKGAKITVRHKAEEGKEGDLIAEATADELGDFVVRADRPVSGDVVVTMTKAPYAELTRELHLEQTGTPPFLGEEMPGAITIDGQVIEALTDKPIPGASIVLSDPCHELEATSDEHGRFELKGISPRHAVLTVEASGFGRERRPVSIFSEDPVGGDEPRIRDGSEVLIILMKPERIVHLMLVDDLGAAIPGVAVECYDEPRDDFRTQVSDAKGEVTFKGLHFDARSLSLRLSHDDHVSSVGFDRTINLPEDKPESMDRLRLERAGGVSGKVIDAGTRKPLSGARVVGGDVYSDDTPRDWSDFEGLYSIRGLRPGPCVLTVHMSGYAPEMFELEITVGETTRRDIRLETGAVLRGIVRTDKGEPLRRAFIETGRWRGVETLGLRAQTDASGEFAIYDAPRDEFEITVYAPGYGSVTRTVVAGGSEPVEIELPKTEGRPESVRLSKIKVGQRAPLFEVTTLDGKSIKLADLEGKIVLLDFWATWCAPCVALVPEHVGIYRKFGGLDNFVMVSVSLDFDERKLRDFIKKSKMAWHQVWGEKSGARATGDAYGVSAIPELFIIGPDGVILESGLFGGQLAKRLSRHIGGENKP